MTHSQNEKKSGPEPERLKINGGWKHAVKKAIHSPPPKNQDKDAKMVFEPGEVVLWHIGAREPERVTFVKMSEQMLARPKNVAPSSNEPQTFPPPEKTAVVRDARGEEHLVLLADLEKLE